jgi:hypothetical protein
VLVKPSPMVPQCDEVTAVARMIGEEPRSRGGDRRNSPGGSSIPGMASSAARSARASRPARRLNYLRCTPRSTRTVDRCRPTGAVHDFCSTAAWATRRRRRRRGTSWRLLSREGVSVVSPGVGVASQLPSACR